MSAMENEKLDGRGWRSRHENELGARVCARPGCVSMEFRINGYCSCECERLHEVEEERNASRSALEAVKAENERLREALRGLLALVELGSSAVVQSQILLEGATNFGTLRRACEAWDAAFYDAAGNECPTVIAARSALLPSSLKGPQEAT